MPDQVTLWGPSAMSSDAPRGTPPVRQAIAKKRTELADIFALHGEALLFPAWALSKKFRGKFLARFDELLQARKLRLTPEYASRRDLQRTDHRLRTGTSHLRVSRSDRRVSQEDEDNSGKSIHRTLSNACAAWTLHAGKALWLPVQRSPEAEIGHDSFATRCENTRSQDYPERR